MDRLDLFPVNRAPVPLHVPDQRPTADAAAMARSPGTAIPLPIAPIPSQGISQLGAVARSLMRDEPASPRGTTTDPTLPIDKRLNESARLLKPYGLSMLPDPNREDPIAANTSLARETAATTPPGADDARAENRVVAEGMTGAAAVVAPRSERLTGPL